MLVFRDNCQFIVFHKFSPEVIFTFLISQIAISKFSEFCYASLSFLNIVQYYYISNLGKYIYDPRLLPLFHIWWLSF